MNIDPKILNKMEANCSNSILKCVHHNLTVYPRNVETVTSDNLTTIMHHINGLKQKKRHDHFNRGRGGITQISIVYRIIILKKRLVKPEVEGNLLNLINICPNFHVINGTSGDIFPSTSETLPVLNTVLETISHKKAIA